jgi:hypothetical protein
LRSAWGSATEATLARFPCIHAGFGTPRRWLQCDFETVKVNYKSPFSTIFLGFCAEISDFCPKLPGFAGFRLAAHSETLPYGCSQLNAHAAIPEGWIELSPG